MKVLLVEDDEPTARIVRRLLLGGQDLDEVHVEADLEGGLRAGEAGDYDALVLDLALPDAHGLDAVRAFVAQQPELPICILTSSEDDELVTEALALGAEDFMIKRTDMASTLPVRVRQAALRRRARQHMEHGAMVQERDDLVRALINEAAHELRTPLTAIRNAEHTLREGALGAAQRQRLLRNLARLHEAVDDFLGALPKDHKLEPVRIIELVNDALPQEHRVTVRVGDAAVQAERAGLGRLLRIVAGIAAMEDTRATIEAREGSLGRVAIDVVYNGDRHPEEDHPMRMALARSLARQSMGRLGVRREDDENRITIHLKAWSSAPAEEPVPAAGLQQRAAATNDAASASV